MKEQDKGNGKGNRTMDKDTAYGMMHRACMVIFTDPKIVGYLAINDPQALRQVRRAVEAAEAESSESKVQRDVEKDAAETAGEGWEGPRVLPGGSPGKPVRLHFRTADGEEEEDVTGFWGREIMPGTGSRVFYASGGRMLYLFPHEVVSCEEVE